MPNGNSIETLNPLTGTFTSPVPLASEPTRMALSDDGQILYVLSTGANEIVRFNMLTQQRGFSFPVTSVARDLATSVQFSVQTVARIRLQSRLEHSKLWTSTPRPRRPLRVLRSPCPAQPIARCSSTLRRWWQVTLFRLKAIPWCLADSEQSILRLWLRLCLTQHRSSW